MEPRLEDERPVALDCPDIARHAAGNRGLDYVWTYDAALPGPHVAIVALVHGNEIGGAVALDRLLRAKVRPHRGRLTLIFANVAAYLSLDPRDPDAARFLDEDFNRLWDEATLAGPRHSRELARARALRPLIDSVDVLLDLHSMQRPDPPLALCGALAKGRALAAQVGVPELVVADAGHAAGRRLRDYGAFSDPRSPRAALLVECGQHYAPASAALAWEAALRFLAALALVPADFAAARLAPEPPPPQRFVEVTEAVTASSDDFAFVRPFKGLEALRKGEPIARDGTRTIVAPYDGCLLVMPSQRLKKGLTAVRLGRYLPGGG